MVGMLPLFVLIIIGYYIHNFLSQSNIVTLMAGVPLADFTTVLQWCHAVLNVTRYIFSFGVSLCCLRYAAKSKHIYNDVYNSKSTIYLVSI